MEMLRAQFKEKQLRKQAVSERKREHDRLCRVFEQHHNLFTRVQVRLESAVEGGFEQHLFEQKYSLFVGQKTVAFQLPRELENLHEIFPIQRQRRA